MVSICTVAVLQRFYKTLTEAFFQQLVEYLYHLWRYLEMNKYNDGNDYNNGNDNDDNNTRDDDDDNE